MITHDRENFTLRALKSLDKSRDYGVKTQRGVDGSLGLISGKVQDVDGELCVLTYYEGAEGLHWCPMRSLYRYSDRAQKWVRVRAREYQA